jgi:hypothetical protein
MENWFQAYGRAWQRHFETVGEIWNDLSSKDASMSTWNAGYSKLMQVWTDNARELFGAYTQHGAAAQGTVPVIAFALDTVAGATGGPTPLTLPPGVDGTKVVATPLVNIADSGAGPIAKVELSSSGGCTVDVRIAGVRAAPTNASTSHVAFIIDPPPAAGSKPPPRMVYAIVSLTFLP